MHLKDISAYQKAPCRYSSLPWWKMRRYVVPDNMIIVHDDAYDNIQYSDYDDQRYFRLYHDMHGTAISAGEVVELRTACDHDIDIMVDIINKSYDDIRVSRAQMVGYRNTPVFDADLWLLALDRPTGRVAGCAIADYDADVGELILEWIQVLPIYRRRGIAKALVLELLRRRRQAGFATVSGRVDNPTNPSALYRACGFTGTDIWHILTRQPHTQ